MSRLTQAISRARQEPAETPPRDPQAQPWGDFAPAAFIPGDHVVDLVAARHSHGPRRGTPVLRDRLEHIDRIMREQFGGERAVALERPGSAPVHVPSRPSASGSDRQRSWGRRLADAIGRRRTSVD